MDSEKMRMTCDTWPHSFDHAVKKACRAKSDQQPSKLQRCNLEASNIAFWFRVTWVGPEFYTPNLP